MNKKLIRTDYIISIYNITQEEPIQQFDLLNVTVEILKEIITPNNNDPFLIDGYILEENQVIQLANFSRDKIPLNFSVYRYVLEPVGIYE